MGFNVCILLIFYTWINNVYRVSCYDQLVRPGYTMANSSSVGYMYDGYPNKTVDGDFRQNNYTYCMHTYPGHSEAWLRIDLRKIYNIHSVKLWYRNDSILNTRRILGFSIRLSNTSWSIPGDICYQDDGKTILPPIIGKQCEGVAQFVWIYTNKLSTYGSILEVCEVQVFGCSYQNSDGNCLPCDQCKNDCNINRECDEQGCKSDRLTPPFCKECDNGTFGLHCRYNCSGHCSRGLPCNKVNGICLSGCADGWINPYCNETCRTNFYGKNCSSLCGQCANNATCDHVTGFCPSGLCKRGWKNTNDKRCNEECENGTFGSNCQSKCSGHCAGGLPCNKVDGICTEGCAVGWINPYCNDTCQTNFYGKNCSFPCGHCANNATCDHVTGSCPSGFCKRGWKNTNDKSCYEECENGTFGSNCQSKCSEHCAGGIPCNKIDGICSEGCALGWINPYCNDTCQTNFYGKNCSFPCGQCANNATCDHVTGSCPSGVCKRGWKNTSDKRCNKECDDRTFGLHCRFKCSGHCAGGLSCNKVNGSCPVGCEDGWINLYCNDTCRNSFYGRNCSFPCGYCANNASCDHVTGFCPSGLCERGWKNTSDKRCNKECDNGTFGLHCRFKCSEHCAGKMPCNKVDGICPKGCEDGWINSYCNDTCRNNFYGEHCSFPCGQCANNATCDHVTGSCPSGLCKRGWKNTSDKRCNKECDDGTFGLHCRFKCSGHCAGEIPCDKVDGICTEGCAVGWINQYCNDTNNQAQECNSNQIVISSLYGVIAALVFSILLNIFLIVRNARKAFNRRQSLKKGNKEQNSTIETYVNSPGMIEENTAYQELTLQLNNPSINDTEESYAGYQELGQLSQPSHYEELKRF